MILGPSGTGKSTSIKGLDPKETVVLNVLRKRLPFKGSGTVYNTDNKNLFNVDEHTQIVNLLNSIDQKAPHVKNVIVEDMTYVMRKEFFKRAKETGYGKYTELAQHFQQIISTCENMRENINVFFILHSEPVQSDKVTIGFKVSTIGALIDNQYNPVEVVPMVLYSAIQYKDNKPVYGFYTHAVMDKGAIIPSKTPEGMFEEDFIPNDLGFVVKTMDEYYG